MTRETKIGLIIAGSFLCLVCIVVASKIRKGDAPTQEPEEQSVNIAANQVNDGKPENEPAKNDGKANPQALHAQAGNGGPSIPKKQEGAAPNAHALPLNNISGPTQTVALSDVETKQKKLQDTINAQKGTGTPAPIMFPSDNGPLPIGGTPGFANAQLPPLAAPPGTVEKKIGDVGFPAPPGLPLPSGPMPQPGFPATAEIEKKKTQPAPPTEFGAGLKPEPGPMAMGKQPNALKPDTFGPHTAPEPKKENFGSLLDNAPTFPVKKDEIAPPAFVGAKVPSPNEGNALVPPPPNAGAIGAQQPLVAPMISPQPLPGGNPLPPGASEPPKSGFPGELPQFGKTLKPEIKEAPLPGPPSSFPPIGTAPAIAPIAKQPDPMPMNPNFPQPGAPPQPFKPDNAFPPAPVPTIVGKDGPATPPITNFPESGPAPGASIQPIPPKRLQADGPIPTIPPISKNSGKPIGVVMRSTPDFYVCQPGEQNFMLLSQRFYGSEKYANALFAYNYEHRSAVPSGANLAVNPPILNPGQQVLVPTKQLLENDYPARIPIQEPNPIAPVVSNAPAIVGPAPKVQLAPPAPLISTVPTTPVQAVIPARNTPTADKTTSYTVQNPGGENILDIAQRVMGNRSLWHEIYRINPAYRPEFTIPQGTVLRIPAN